MKDVWAEKNLPMTNYVWFYDVDYKKDKDEVLKDISKLEFPVIVKPATTGSSVGISVCENKEKLIEGIDEAIQYDTKIVVEEVVKNLKEVNIAVMGNYEHQRLVKLKRFYLAINS